MNEPPGREDLRLVVAGYLGRAAAQSGGVPVDALVDLYLAAKAAAVRRRLSLSALPVSLLPGGRRVVCAKQCAVDG